MAAFNKFQKFIADLANGGIDIATATYKFILTNNLPDSANWEHYADVTGELSTLHGYTNGGQSSATISASQTGGVYTLKLTDISWTATGGSIGPFQYVILYDTVSNLLIGWFDYGSALTVSSGLPFQIQMNPTTGILQAA